MAIDILIRNARLAGSPAEAPPVDIAVAGGRIAAVGPGIEADAEVVDAGGRLVSPGLVETHVHLDKSRIVDRCAPAAGRCRWWCRTRTWRSPWRTATPW